VISQINRQSVSSPTDVADALATAKPGQTVSVGIVTSDGSHTTVKVKLGQYPGAGA
jgi:S1-C subfamily serine protease